MNFRTTMLAALACVAALSSCQKKDNAVQVQQKQQEELQQATKDELIQAVAERDELISLLGDINTDIQEVKRLENVLAANPEGETSDQRRQIKSDIASIRQTLESRRVRLAELEARLQKSNTANETLRNTITTLREQIDLQSAEIQRLTGMLAESQQQVAQLNTANDSLSQTVTAVTDQRDAERQANAQLTQEMNTVYYVVATDRELKDHGIVQKKKVMLGDYDQSFFIRADKRNLTKIPLRTTKKVEVLTPMPAGAYTILEDANKVKTLVITNPEAFWRQSPYLVVKIK